MTYTRDRENRDFSANQPPFLRENVGSRRQSTTSFSENVVMAKTSYQMLEVLSFSDWERD